ncbi:MAG: DUF4437 domain-containing protein [Phycisphaerales bacterium JB058]
MQRTQMTRAMVVAALVGVGLVGGAMAQESEQAGIEVVPMSEVEWGALNPARGENSPRAGGLWGDRTGDGASGFLVKFVDGFASPPHIHNITYRGVVISGLIHNDDPKAANQWLPVGSFWVQPAGEAHITAAEGRFNMAYIEIEEGPYLVLPEAEAFDNGERPINVDESNFVWLDATDITWIEGAPDEGGAQIAFLWGKTGAGELGGSLVKLPAGFAGRIVSRGDEFRAVVIQGKPSLGERALEQGSYFGSDGVRDDGPTEFRVTGDPETESLIYIRSEGGYELASD